MSVSAPTATTTAASRWWQRWYAALPMLLLAAGTAVSLATEQDQGHGVVRTRWLLVLVGVTACVNGALLVRGHGRPAVPTSLTPSVERQVLYTVRTGLAFVMTWLNPFMALFAFAGYLDAFDVFRRRRAMVAMFATAVTVAGAQSGGLPPRGQGQWVVFGVLVVFNAALASAFTYFHASVEETSHRRAETITELERVNADLEHALAENASLTQTVLAQARQAGIIEERQRLAREIHDTLAQDLAGIVAQLQALRGTVDPSGSRLDTAHRLARAALTEARRSVLDLSPAGLDGATLPSALGAVVHQWTDEHGVAGELTVTGAPVGLHGDVEATLIRVVQEALANVAKHASATRVGVTLTYEPDEVLLDVRDNGCGFDSGADHGPSSFGLRGIRQRADRVAGALEIESRPGRGTAISLRLPAVPAGSAA